MAVVKAFGCIAAVVLASTASAASDFMELDEKNWAAMTENRNCFVMFQAPW
jgi:hypothetical protein